MSLVNGNQCVYYMHDVSCAGEPTLKGKCACDSDALMSSASLLEMMYPILPSVARKS